MYELVRSIAYHGESPSEGGRGGPFFAAISAYPSRPAAPPHPGPHRLLYSSTYATTDDGVGNRIYRIIVERLCIYPENVEGRGYVSGVSSSPGKRANRTRVR
jgi:hypothetical protein